LRERLQFLFRRRGHNVTSQGPFEKKSTRQANASCEQLWNA